MQVKEYLKVHQLHLRKCTRKINPLQGVLNIFSVALPTAPTEPSHSLTALCICLYSSVGWRLLCLIGHRILNPFPQWSGKPWQQHMALASLDHPGNSTFPVLGELQTLPQQPKLKHSLPFPTGMDTCPSRARAE